MNQLIYIINEEEGGMKVKGFVDLSEVHRFIFNLK